VGKLFGIERAARGGIGSAAFKVGQVTVGALVAVNAIGDVVDADGSVIAGARLLPGARPGRAIDALLAGAGPARVLAGTATTIGVVATDAQLTKAQANKLAALAHAGLARAVEPLTMHDGDTLFALATARAGITGDLSVLGAIAAEAVAVAIRRAVRAAGQAPTGQAASR
jgi:L-aminopeptidase/D-esterase-like protein